MARKSKYDTHIAPMLETIEGWARNGLTLDDIAHNLGISKTTLIKYRDTHEELYKALFDGKEIADLRVENALYRRALGFYSTVKKPMKVKTINGEEVIEFEEEVYYPPDVTAMIYWLKNRKPEAWRDKIEAQIETGEDNLLIIAPVKNE